MGITRNSPLSGARGLSARLAVRKPTHGRNCFSAFQNLQLTTDVGDNHINQMTTENTQAPTASTAADVATAPIARTSDNITGAEMLAALSKRRASAPDASPASNPPPAAPQSAAPAIPASTPTPEPEAAPDNSNAASTSETAPPSAEEEAITDLTAPDEPGEPPAEPSQDSPKDEPKGIQSLLKRVDTLTARLREAEAKLAEKPVPVAEPAAEIRPEAREGDFGHLPAVQAVNTDIAKWRAVDQWISENPDGGDILDARGNVVQSVSAEDARRTRLQADEKLAELRATKAVLVQSLRAQDASIRQQAESRAAEAFAWLKDPADAKRKALEEIVALVPEIQRLPAWKLFAAHAIDGYTKATTKTTTPVVRPQPPKVAVPNGSAAPRVNPATKALAEAEAAFEKTGSANDYKRVQQLRRESRMARAS